MSANDRRGIRRNQASEAAAVLKRRGILHGMRETTTHAPPITNLTDVGAAKYRRMRKA